MPEFKHQSFFKVWAFLHCSSFSEMDSLKHLQEFQVSEKYSQHFQQIKASLA